MVIGGVLFDLDGTLFDHRSAADRGVRAWLSSLGLDGEIEEQVDRWFALETLHHERFQRGEISHVEHRRARIRAFFPHQDLTHDTVADDTFAGYLGFYRAAWSAFTDAAAALESALAAGLPVGILTNGEQTVQETKVSRTGLASYGVPVLASSSLPAAKPDPRAFRAACAAIGVAPGRCLMVGDSLRHDVRGAVGAGLTGVLVDRYGRYDRRPGDVAGVRRVRSLAELSW